MTGGVKYRLGVLSGQLKGYEREEDLVRFVKKGNKNEVQRFKKDGSFAEEGEESYIL